MSSSINKMIYPVTLVRDRYNGVCSGGSWTAWNLYPEDLPIGKDSTPEEAYANLLLAMNLS